MQENNMQRKEEGYSCWRSAGCKKDTKRGRKIAILTGCSVSIALALLCCDRNSREAATNHYSAIIEVDKKVKAAAAVAACRELVHAGINPDEILIRHAEAMDGVAFSSDNGLNYGNLQNLYGPEEYKGRIILISRSGSKVIYSGSSSEYCWYVVDDLVSVGSMIELLKREPKIDYMLYNLSNFRKNLNRMTVVIDPDVTDKLR